MNAIATHDIVLTVLPKGKMPYVVRLPLVTPEIERGMSQQTRVAFIGTPLGVLLALASDGDFSANAWRLEELLPHWAELGLGPAYEGPLDAGEVRLGAMRSQLDDPIFQRQLTF